jgi:hypothetical protein
MLNFQAQLLEFSLLVLYGILFPLHLPLSMYHFCACFCYVQQISHSFRRFIFAFLMFSWPFVEQKLREKRENGTGRFGDLMRQEDFVWGEWRRTLRFDGWF